MSADILEYVDQKVRDSASSSTEWSILYADDWAKLRAEIVRLRGEVDHWRDECALYRGKIDLLMAEVGEADDQGRGFIHKDAIAAIVTHDPSIAPAEAKGGAVACYDAGLLSDYGGGNVDWWWDYIRAELGRAHDFYASQITPQPADGGAVAPYGWHIQYKMTKSLGRWDTRHFIPAYDQFGRHIGRELLDLWLSRLSASDKFGAVLDVSALYTTPPAAQVQQISAGDAVFAFSAMLTGLPHVVPLGASAWATPGVELANAFNVANGLTVSRDFPEGIKFPEIDGELLDTVKRAAEADATHPAGDALGAVRDGYYLASFKHKANNGEVMWWKGDNAGYSPDLAQAGIYTELVPGYHDSEHTVPVPVAFLAGLRVRSTVDPGDSLNHMFWSADRLRAALQHRGDSRGGETTP